MSEFRQRAIEDVARAMGVDAADVVFYMRPGMSSSKLDQYAVARQERVLELEAALHSIATWGDCVLRPDELHGEALEAFSLGSSKAFEQQAKIARGALSGKKPEATHEA
jgi:hypothetical protein